MISQSLYESQLPDSLIEKEHNPVMLIFINLSLLIEYSFELGGTIPLIPCSFLIFIHSLFQFLNHRKNEYALASNELMSHTYVIR